jgi:hypothetical protein
MIQAIRAIRGVAGVHIMAPRQDQFIPDIVRDSGVLDGRRPGTTAATAGTAPSPFPARDQEG